MRAAARPRNGPRSAALMAEWGRSVGIAVDRENNYRRSAMELRRQARTELNVSTRVELELLALAYDRLADQARRNARNNIVTEYAEVIAERRQQERSRR